MSQQSTIEWTNSTWNPARGCTKVSPGCKHCYAETLAERFRGTPGHTYEHGFDLRLVPEALDLPLKWRKGRLIFVNSMSDLFHEGIPDEYIARVFDVMRRATQHQFQLLTKRADRMEQFAAYTDVPPNVWLGVSVESEEYKWRVDYLRRARARIRFISIEPLLGAVGRLDLHDIHWVIVGGESGRGARPMEPGWVRAVRSQCRAARVPFFFKQWGGVQKKRNGRTLDGRTYDEMPSFTLTQDETTGQRRLSVR